MKKITLYIIIIMATMTSCSFESYLGCPAYSHQNKSTKHGTKAQNKYAKRHGGRLI